MFGLRFHLYFFGASFLLIQILEASGKEKQRFWLVVFAGGRGFWKMEVVRNSSDCNSKTLWGRRGGLAYL